MGEEAIQSAIREIRARDVDGEPLWRVCCDIVRVLLLLRGAAWDTDLVNELRNIWARRGWREEKVGKLLGYLDGAAKTLQSKGILSAQRRKRSRLTGVGTVEGVLYSLKHQRPVMRGFADDRELLRLELSRM
ncbi:TPA: hypothetical protein EYP44_04750 [Candidatus Bathyarchaeota archaeon]|nr:hypothetical protein [Candidatus Bathyarchaeota archaeon]